ncbi:MAG TPA: LysM peptidoglycan-binding domain-containing protein [Planctomycetota bacterium]
MTLVLFAIIAFAGWLVGPHKASTEGIEAEHATAEADAMPVADLLPPEQRRSFLSAEDFRREAVRNPRTGVGGRPVFKDDPSLPAAAWNRDVGAPDAARRSGLAESVPLSLSPAIESGAVIAPADARGTRWTGAAPVEPARAGNGSAAVDASGRSRDARYGELAVPPPAILPSAELAPPGAPEPPMRKYAVTSGDSMGRISQRFYGTARHAQMLADVNGIQDPSLVRVGQVLRVPYLDGETPDPAPGADRARIREEAAPLRELPQRHPGARRYTVASGDSLSEIAARFYGTPKHWRALARENGLGADGAVRVGQVLVLPELDGLQPAGAEAQRRDADGGAGPAAVVRTYRVGAGDTLTKIAKKVYGDANLWTRIRDANGISDPSKIRVGQTLRIPAGG